MTWALWVLMLLEILVRRGQQESVEKLPGLSPGPANRTAERPTGSRMLTAIAPAGAGVTAMKVDDGRKRRWHLSPLPELLHGALCSRGLPEAVYNRIVINSHCQPLGNLAKIDKGIIRWKLHIRSAKEELLLLFRGTNV